MSADRTNELLRSLHPIIQLRAYYFVVAARNAGIPLVLISARRSFQANRDIGGAEKSYHLSGNAFDVGVHGYVREQIAFEWWRALGEWAEKNLGLFWGGRFFHRGGRDVNHFDSRRFLLRV